MAGCQVLRAPEGHRRHHGRLTPMALRGSPATSVRYIHFSTLSASGFPGTLSEMNASRRKTCSDDTCTNFSTADPVPAESSTSLDEIQRSDIVVQLIGHVSSVLEQGSLRHHVDELLLKGNWIPNRCYIMSTNCCSSKATRFKSDRCLDRGLVAFVVFNTKLDAIHDDFMSRVVDDRRRQDSKFDQFGQTDRSLVVCNAFGAR